MKMMPFQRPTEHYDERVSPIDEQICALIRQRKDVSNNNPGYPPLEEIARWAQEFGLYEDFLHLVFGNLRNEQYYRPRVEPQTFRKNVRVLKAVEKDGEMYTVTFIRQYDNASIVNLDVDSEPITDRPGQPSRHRFFELFLGEGYDCRGSGGGGSQGHQTYQFIVAPPLPDDTSGLRLVFKEYSSPFGDPTGFEVIIE